MSRSDRAAKPAPATDDDRAATTPAPPDPSTTPPAAPTSATTAPTADSGAATERPAAGASVAAKKAAAAATPAAAKPAAKSAAKAAGRPAAGTDRESGAGASGSDKGDAAAAEKPKAGAAEAEGAKRRTRRAGAGKPVGDKPETDKPETDKPDTAKDDAETDSDKDDAAKADARTAKADDANDDDGGKSGGGGKKDIAGDEEAGDEKATDDGAGEAEKDGEGDLDDTDSAALPSWAQPDPPPPTPGRGMPVLPAAALAALSGTVMLAAFPPYGWWWLAPVAVALLALATRAQRIRRGAWLGALHGAAFFVPLLYWTGLHVGWPPWILLAGLQTVFLALLGAAAAGSSRFVAAAPWTAPLVTALLWVGQEALRSRIPFGGFPWGRIAFSQDESPLLRLASIGGAPLVTFTVALAGGLLAAAAVRPVRQRRSVRALVLVTFAVALSAAGFAVPITEPGGTKVTVAIIQGNVPRLGLDFNAQRRQVLENHVDATRALARRVEAGDEPQPDLVIWPENSSDIDPLVDSDAGDLISTAAAEIKAPILVGAVLEGPGRFVTNAGIVWDPAEGPGEQYAKRHPVPFAEYMPMRSIARKVSDKVDLVRRDFKGGSKVGTMDVGPAKVGDVICFEVAYDELVRDTVTAGAELIVVQTNNATFDRSPESAQQLAMVRLRAVEHGRAAIMSSTSGVSATVTARGEILDESGLFTQATFVRSMRLGEHRTLATIVGGIPEAVLSLLAVLPLIIGLWLRRRARGHERRARSVESSSDDTPETDEPDPDEQDGEKPSTGDKAEKQKEDA